MKIFKAFLNILLFISLIKVDEVFATGSSSIHLEATLKNDSLVKDVRSVEEKNFSTKIINN